MARLCAQLKDVFSMSSKATEGLDGNEFGRASPVGEGVADVYDGYLGDQDARDMQRLGKQQLFKRNFSFISTLGFISIYMATWEFVLVSLALGLINGGFGGLFWTFIGTVIC